MENVDNIDIDIGDMMDGQAIASGQVDATIQNALDSATSCKASKRHQRRRSGKGRRSKFWGRGFWRLHSK